MVNTDIAENSILDKVEELIMYALADDTSNVVPVNCPLVHRFTKGMYSREITMPVGTLILSEKHKTDHQFILSEGVVGVWDEQNGWQLLSAPFHGITKAGTQRLLRIEYTSIWTTFHPTELKTVEEIHDSILEKRANPLIKGRFENNVFVSTNSLEDV